MNQRITGVFAAIVIAMPAMGDSVDVGFVRITGNSAENVASQLNMRVQTVSGDATLVDFIFTNNVGIASSISEIYLDNGESDGEDLVSGSIFGQVGTNFS